MQRLPYLGSTSHLFGAGDGVVIKSPMKIWEGNANRKALEAENAKAFDIERKILERLGHHPRIVPYLGACDSSSIKLSEASNGSLQAYLEKHNSIIGEPLRYKWCIELAEGFAYIHSRGVIHSDMRLDNVLVNATLGLWLCDFGGSTCDALGLNGGHLPDDPFFDPRLGFVSTPATDIFSLGTLLFVILTGHLPFGTGLKGEPFTNWRAYEEHVNERFEAGEFPEVAGLTGGNVIWRCWHHKEDFGFKTAADVVLALKYQLPSRKDLERGSAAEHAERELLAEKASEL
ncbi:kinase-like domain-containing protein [Lophiotrema nucula]|uniref:EKC/KEOPS complex subunit BUD32 n=1 Tax=Lophiotrema nucula TaxID=690887 RepID=A0A6A5YEX6_9PLEO|nr:kinase-like domain-containing protein [Lophiotrema nucula]